MPYVSIVTPVYRAELGWAPTAFFEEELRHTLRWVASARVVGTGLS